MLNLCDVVVMFVKVMLQYMWLSVSDSVPRMAKGDGCSVLEAGGAGIVALGAPPRANLVLYFRSTLLRVLITHATNCVG